MNTQVIRGGDIQVLTIDGIEYPIPEETECKIVFTVKNRDARSNEVTQCTANTIISYGKREKAGIYGITIAIREDLIEHFADMRDSGGAYKVILTLTSGTSFEGELVISGSPQMGSKDHKTEVDLLGNRFARM
ncbi:hypothetical protein [Brachyspira hyodysenteriae]|uniref:hypothetical protein n=1 Tax=Brachyspira hyodysenteriae TaxID=159 RepID=UPI00063DD24E|nr:hypothetical protein [Brachyspira hyodysenteriae]KLI53604.1 hypothetical protein SZ42_00500 [Brachyspira hyodysenteriae]